MTLRRLAPFAIVVAIALAAWAVVSLRDTSGAADAGAPMRVDVTPVVTP